MVVLDAVIGISLAVLAVGAVAGVSMAMYCCGQRLFGGRQGEVSGDRHIVG